MKVKANAYVQDGQRWDADTYSVKSGATVTLATGIPEHVVRAANLDYLDPALVDLDLLAADPDTLVVAQAGEVLYRLR